jgi:hypothetical protein
MANIHDEFEAAIMQCRFKKDFTKQYDYVMFDGVWFYKLNFEGYAYVLYQEINIYVKPLMYLFRIYNKFAKGEAQIGLHYAVPIAHFREPQKLIDIMAILTDKLDEKEQMQNEKPD